MKTSLPVIIALAAAQALAEDTRQLDAHEHGTGALNIAISGTTVAMELHVPGADIVGFEYAAKSAEDRAAIDDAVAALARPMTLFALPDAAACSVTSASAALETEAEAEHDHDAAHAHQDHDTHDDHVKEDGNENHDDHAKHEDHGEGHKHDDHDHAAHHGENRHSEFHAEYSLTCANPEKLSEITFAYFDRFENARELDIQIVGESGAQAAEVTRESPVLDLRGMF